MIRHLGAAAAFAAGVLSFTSASAQSNPRCDAMLNQKITASGPILRIVEMEIFIDAVLFRDTKTGCQFVLLEGLLDSRCKEGRTITVSGVVKRDSLTKGLEIDPGGVATAACR
jgi:hypothetical protein